MLLREISNVSANTNTATNTVASQRVKNANRSALDLWRPKEINKGLISSSSKIISSSVM